MESHIAFLRAMTDMVSADGWKVSLVGFLGGDKLSAESPPHLPPGDLGAWGPVDEFLIMNARRPVDFYTPGENCAPRDLPGCTAWERGQGEPDGKFLFRYCIVLSRLPLRIRAEADAGDAEDKLGVEWACTALTVPGQPRITLRASASSASNGVSSTKIRKIMCEAADEELCSELKGHVLGCDLLVEWLLEHRGRGKSSKGGS